MLPELQLYWALSKIWFADRNAFCEFSIGARSIKRQKCKSDSAGMCARRTGGRVHSRRIMQCGTISCCQSPCRCRRADERLWLRAYSGMRAVEHWPLVDVVSDKLSTGWSMRRFSRPWPGSQVSAEHSAFCCLQTDAMTPRVSTDSCQ